MSVTKPTTKIVFDPGPRKEPALQGISDEDGTLRLPGTDHLGCGYNVFKGKDFPDSSASGESLFDLGTYEPDTTLGTTYLAPNRIRVLKPAKGMFETTEGETAREYQKNLAVQFGIDIEDVTGAFGGALDFRFDRSVRRCSSAYFLSRYMRLHRGLLRLPDDHRDMLTEDAKRDLETRDPEDLFEKYGTHYLYGLVIGAEAIYNVATNTAEVAKDMNISVTAKESLDLTLGRIESTQGAEFRERMATFDRHSSTKLVVRGGRGEYGSDIDREGNYDKWVESIEGDVAFVAVPEGDLRPIWELCDGERRDQIETAFREYASEFEPEPEPTIAPVFGYSADNPRRWYYSLSPSDKVTGGWTHHEKPFFYVSTEPETNGAGEDVRVPVYRHSSPDPIRYKLSVKQHEGHKWSDETEPVWYAYPPEAADAPGRVAIYGHTAPTHTGTSGWFYNVRDEPRGWNRKELAFYADVVEFGSA